MRIAMDYQIFCLQAYGGISRYFVRLAEQFSERSETVRIFSPLHCNEYLDGLTPSLVDGRRIVSSASKTMRLTLPYNNFISGRKISVWQPDILHETYYSFFNKKPQKKPVVITVYDMVHEIFPDQFSRLGNISLRKRNAVQRADHIICISESTRRDLIRLFDVDDAKVSVVYLGFDKFSYQPSSDHSIESRIVNPYLLFVGNRGGYKNFAGFLKAFSLSDRLKENFDIISFGGGAFTPDEKSLIADLGLSASKVRQLAGGDDTLGNLYRGAAIFVYPSLYEGFGLPPLEAMANDCPVALSSTSSMPEVVGEAGAYFDPSSVEDMSSVIEKLAFSPSLSRALIENGRERLKKFSWENCAEQTLAVYRGLMR
ncbi:glycosyltransferase family 4 protein [Pseudomonas sp. B14(2022)]|uniref:glycosyltransferase family 4 protein n=1 Tax=Pseudomonas sp. B14(2022) TaxID=2914043 RepID=UPI00142F5337|nr:glycosyltransferase family 1 protein [Pseudomonas sp. B14(2022)]NJJ58728.1 glycosyltransferase family 4 protein [Pseudomonas sp. B14(2022)]